MEVKELPRNLLLMVASDIDKACEWLMRYCPGPAQAIRRVFNLNTVFSQKYFLTISYPHVIDSFDGKNGHLYQFGFAVCDNHLHVTRGEVTVEMGDALLKGLSYSEHLKSEENIIKILYQETLNLLTKRIRTKQLREREKLHYYTKDLSKLRRHDVKRIHMRCDEDIIITTTSR